MKLYYPVHLIPGHKNATVQRACEDVALGDPVESMFISDRTMAQCVAEKFTLERALWCLSHGRLRLIQESRSLRIIVRMSVCLNMLSTQIHFSGK